jgi:hypothetical protein
LEVVQFEVSVIVPGGKNALAAYPESHRSVTSKYGAVISNEVKIFSKEAPSGIACVAGRSFW